MYKFVIVAAFALADCAVLELQSPAPAPEAFVMPSDVKANTQVAILSQESDASYQGAYNWSFEAADGTRAEQTAEVKTLDKETVIEDIHGSYSYVDPAGKTHAVQYAANEYGFFPKGDDISPEVARYLAYLEAHPEPLKGENQPEDNLR